MIILRKILSALLVSILLVAITGVSFSKHVCLSGKSATCEKRDSCCKNKHSNDSQKSKCCTIQDFYFKANIVSTHDKSNHKFFPDNFVSIFQNHFFVAPLQRQYAQHNINHKPPLLQSGRSILLDSSRLTV
jgi:hypothetical protein